METHRLLIYNGGRILEGLWILHQQQRREALHLRESVCVCVCVCVCARERERERESASERERARESKRASETERARESEREINRNSNKSALVSGREQSSNIQYQLTGGVLRSNQSTGCVLLPRL